MFTSARIDSLHSADSFVWQNVKFLIYKISYKTANINVGKLFSETCRDNDTIECEVTSQSPPLLSPSITLSAFHARLKTHLFHKSFPR